MMVMPMPGRSPSCTLSSSPCRRVLRLVHDDEVGGAADLDHAAVELAHPRGVAGGKAERQFGRHLAERGQQRHHAQDAERLHAGAGRRVGAEDDAAELAQLARGPQREERGALVAVVNEFEAALAPLADAADLVVGQRGWPPLIWPMTSASASSTTSLSIRPEPGIDGPPVWIVLWMPYLRAQPTILRAVGPSLTPPRPTSPSSFTPAAASSLKSSSTMPLSITGAPACTFTPPGRSVRTRAAP